MKILTIGSTADYTATLKEDVICIVDTNKGNMRVTNNAQAIIEEAARYTLFRYFQRFRGRMGLDFNPKRTV